MSDPRSISQVRSESRGGSLPARVRGQVDELVKKESANGKPYWELKLRDAGTIQSFEKLNAAALAKHPGGQVTETELEEEYGRYIYQVEVRDAQGVKWDLELDATNGQILQDHQDD